MNKHIVISLFSTTWLLLACGDAAGILQPGSGGLPYEVCVYANDKACADVTDSILSQPVPSLPQYEPLFDVIRPAGSQPDAAMQLARAIVIINKNPAKYASTSIKYEKNAWVHPQITVYVNTPSAEALAHSLRRNGGCLIDLLMRFEMNTAMSSITKNGESEASKIVKRIFGYDMAIPVEMRVMKKDHDFLWLSDNGTEMTRNICIYSYKANGFDLERATAARDSIMARNMTGEYGGTHVQTVDGSTTSVMKTENRRIITVCRGLWQMTGDAMGGPFVNVSVTDTANARITVAEALVYAPGRKKRNTIRRLEAALYTIKKNKE